MSRPNFAPERPKRPSPVDPPGGATEALWQYLRRIESGLDQIDARIDRLYVALGGGTVLLATIGLVSAFIVRGG